MNWVGKGKQRKKKKKERRKRDSESERQRETERQRRRTRDREGGQTRESERQDARRSLEDRDPGRNALTMNSKNTQGHKEVEGRDSVRRNGKVKLGSRTVGQCTMNHDAIKTN
jgi:hypothetical protein